MISSYDQGRKGEVDEHAFFCEASGTMRKHSGSSVLDHNGTSSSWQLAPLTMGSPLGNHLMKQRSSYSGSTGDDPSCLQLQSLNYDDNNNTTIARQQKQVGQQQYYAMDREDRQPKKVMHHFIDEWPPKDNEDSCWLDNNDHDHKLSKIQLSISMPNSSSHNDPKW